MTEHSGEPASAPDLTLYSVEEAASILGIGRTFMFRLVATGAIDSLKIGKRRKITRQALDAFVTDLLREQSAR